MFRLIHAVIVLLILSACSQEPKPDAQGQSINPNFLNASGKVADPNYEINFPFDHLPHNEFDIEWWYLTANLKDDDDNDYALQWTLFRFAQNNMQNDWYAGQTFMAHASLHSADEHWFEERFAPGGIGTAGVELATKGIHLFMDNWHWRGQNPAGDLFPSVLETSISPEDGQDAVSMKLQLEPSGPIILQGEQGYSIKSNEGKHASHYYSAPFIEVSGNISLPNKEIKVRGKAWFDHEWTSTLLDASTLGWDWMSLHFDNGDKLMTFQMRLTDQAHYQTGTYIFANGESVSLSPAQISLEAIETYQLDEKTLPIHWRVIVPEHGLNISVEAFKKDAYNPAVFSYYEGAVKVSGSHSGVGFLELTGY